MTTNEITKEEFETFECVRESGVHMWNVTEVKRLSGLDREKILTIIKNYDELNKKYPGWRRG